MEGSRAAEVGTGGVEVAARCMTHAPSDSFTVDDAEPQRHGGAADAHGEDAREHPHFEGQQVVGVLLVLAFVMVVIVFVIGVIGVAIVVVVVVLVLTLSLTLPLVKWIMCVRIDVGVKLHHMQQMGFVVDHPAGIVRQTECTDLTAHALRHTRRVMSSEEGCSGTRHRRIRRATSTRRERTKQPWMRSFAFVIAAALTAPSVPNCATSDAGVSSSSATLVAWSPLRVVGAGPLASITAVSSAANSPWSRRPSWLPSNAGQLFSMSCTAIMSNHFIPTIAVQYDCAPWWPWVDRRVSTPRHRDTRRRLENIG